MNTTKLLVKLVKTIQGVLDNSEVATGTTIDVRHQDTNTGHLVIKPLGADYYYDGLNLLREYIFKKNYKSHESFFDKIYYEFIWSQKIKPGRLHKACKSWLESLKELKTTKFRVMLPINYYTLTRDIELDNIKIIRTNKDTLQRHFGTPNPYDLLTLIEKKTGLAASKTYAIVDVEAYNPDAAKEIGYSIVEKFTHAIRFIDPDSHIQFGKASAIRLSEVFISKSEAGLTHNVNHRNIPRSMSLDKRLEELKPHWDKLMSFLYAKKLTSLQEIIIGALYWFGVSDIYRDSNEKLFLNYMIGLELIVLHDYKQNDKADRFGKNYIKIFSSRSWKVWKKAYQKRNQIVHGGLVNIYKEEVEKMERDLHYLLWKLIDLTNKYDKLDDVLRDEYDIDNRVIQRKQKTCSGQPDSN